ncbi:MAG: hypothetical protein IIX72_00640 [Oscillospiraceae bacterium]|nr:hypothetical protein [Oscillospiraceae bacterium]
MDDMFLGTVSEIDLEKGIKIIVDGQSQASEKYYKCRKGLTLSVGDRVKVAKISGTFVIEYSIGLPARRYNMNQCPTGESATASSCAAWINTIINALSDQDLMSKNGW